jgi:RNA polymerase sigma factor (TIGR02999 family)
VEWGIEQLKVAPMTENNSQITNLLLAWRSGDSAALDQLMPLIYEQMRVLASRYMRKERLDHTLRPTALVHEAYLKLLTTEVRFKDRVHFLAIASITMRRILVEHARNYRSAKRGSGREKVALEDALLVSEPVAIDILDLDAALVWLAEQDPRKARLIELTSFGGMNAEEAATLLDISTATVNRDLKIARAWLQRKLVSAGKRR